MNNNITIFNNNQFGQIRTIVNNDEVWFVAKDVCEALNLGNSREAISKLDNDEKGAEKVDTLGGLQQMSIINESGLYTLVIRSNMPKAKEFRKWVTSDVIPSIRKNGMYATPQTVDQMLNDPDAMISILQQIKRERENNTKLQTQIEQQKPRVLFSRCVEGSDSSILIGDLAKLIAQNNVDVGQNRLFQWMRLNGYLMAYGNSYNTPTQRSIELGVLEMKERIINYPDGRSMTTITPYVTGKGQVYFINKFMKESGAV
jgi:anti-repressor protein